MVSIMWNQTFCLQNKWELQKLTVSMGFLHTVFVPFNPYLICLQTTWLRRLFKFLFYEWRTGRGRNAVPIVFIASRLLLVKCAFSDSNWSHICWTYQETFKIQMRNYFFFFQIYSQPHWHVGINLQKRGGAPLLSPPSFTRFLEPEAPGMSSDIFQFVLLLGFHLITN